MFEGKIHENLERDINHIEGHIKKNVENKQESNIDKKQVIKQSFNTIPNYQPSNQQTVPQEITKEEKTFLPDYIEEGDVDENTKLIIEKLLDMVFHKGVFKVLKIAKKYPPFIQDAFHDALADKLIPELERRGKI
ncbi:MAG: hypothetical protein WDZ80_01160 [Candidatus Paceibacterota bacterium]